MHFYLYFVSCHFETFARNLDMGGLSGEFDLAEYYRLHLGVEQIR